MQLRPRLSQKQSEEVDVMKGKGEIKSYLALGCPHIPFHNKKIMQGIFDLMDTYRFDGLILGGDFIDMASLSSYEKGRVNRTGITLEEEYAQANEILSTLDSKLPKKAKKVYMFGNHENRYWKWLSDVDNSKYGDLLNPTKALNLEKRGYSVYEDYKNDQYKLGSLHIVHGDYWNIHVARKMILVWKRNMLFWHTHRVQLHREGDYCGYNSGFLGDINSPAFDYASASMKSAWGNAFSIIYLDGRRHYVNIINCVGNEFIYNGVRYGG